MPGQQGTVGQDSKEHGAGTARGHYGWTVRNAVPGQRGEHAGSDGGERHAPTPLIVVKRGAVCGMGSDGCTESANRVCDEVRGFTTVPPPPYLNRQFVQSHNGCISKRA